MVVAPRVFLDFALDGTPIGRVVFELFNVSAPKTAENFRALCTGERGVSPISQISLYYKHSKMHRVIPDFMIQGGDFTKGNGTGGESIYGGPFPDEDLSRPVDEAGSYAHSAFEHAFHLQLIPKNFALIFPPPTTRLLVMANKGPNTNNSQFFITLQPSPHLTGKHVVFGRVIRGFDDVIKRIANVPTDEKDRPTVPVEVANCGELELRRPPARKSPIKEQESEGESKSEREDEDERGRKRHRQRSASRSLSRSRSRNPSENDDSEAEAKRHKAEKRARKEKKDKKSGKSSKKSKKRKHGSLSRSHSHSPHPHQKGAPREETEEEYDARLEREERDRIETARLAKLAEMKRRHEAEQVKAQADSGGVVFKGRGRMKFVDPESRSRR